MTIIWSDKSVLNYFDILDFILFLWNEKIESNFITVVAKSIIKLEKNPYLGKPYSKNIRKIILHKNASMFYEYDKENEIITILLFNDNRQNPESYLKLI